MEFDASEREFDGVSLLAYAESCSGSGSGGVVVVGAAPAAVPATTVPALDVFPVDGARNSDETTSSFSFSFSFFFPKIWLSRRLCFGAAMAAATSVSLGSVKYPGVVGREGRSLRSFTMLFCRGREEGGKGIDQSCDDGMGEGGRGTETRPLRLALIMRPSSW
jgi:hypothetical protein